MARYIRIWDVDALTLVLPPVKLLDLVLRVGADPENREFAIPCYRLRLEPHGRMRIQRPVIDRPHAAAAVLRRYYARQAYDREVFTALLLDHHEGLMALVVCAAGGRQAVFGGMADIFRPAIVAGASSLVLAHNHPSGDPTPSGRDYNATHELVAAGALLGLRVVDHLVIGAGRRWTSLLGRRHRERVIAATGRP